MQNLLFAVVLTYLISSCKLTEKNIAKKYRNTGNFENSTLLELKPDNSFRYSMQAGLVFFNASGRWIIVNDTLLLSNADSASIMELKQLSFLIKGKKLIEIRENGLAGVTLK
jgi:hypothetical protein